MVRCLMCSKEVKKCDKCGKLITEETDISQFNDGKQHSCIKCHNKWLKLGLFSNHGDIHKIIDEWFKEKYTDTFVFR